MNGMKSHDTIQFEILEDGVVRFETNAVSGANHKSADELIAELEDMLGGEVETTRKRGHHAHSHQYGHNHVHQ